MRILSIAALLIVGQTTTPIPVEQEPQHKIVYKNEFVRVIDATLPPGYVTLNHSHDVDNVSVTISNGREGEAATRNVGRAGFAKGGYAHSVTNSGSSVMRFIVVEVARSDRPGSSPVELPNHTLESENERVRIYRVKLAKGESIPAHTHPAGWVEVTVAGGSGPGATVWHGGGDHTTLTANDVALELAEIEPK